jgi:hypothetical protein
MPKTIRHRAKQLIIRVSSARFRIAELTFDMQPSNATKTRNQLLAA